MDHRTSLADLTLWISTTDRRVQQSDALSSATITRRFPYPVERMWTAFTDPLQLEKWFGAVSGDCRVGAEVKLDVGAPLQIQSRILRCEAPRQLVITWLYGEPGPDPVDEVELRLSSEDGLTNLNLQHRCTQKVTGGSGRVRLGIRTDQVARVTSKWRSDRCFGERA